MSPILRSLVAGAAVAVAVTPSPAQRAAAAHLARIHTPSGALPPTLMGAFADSTPHTIGLQLSMSSVRRPDATFAGDSSTRHRGEQVFALGADLPLASTGALHRARLGMAIGMIRAQCDRGVYGTEPCDAGFMAGANAAIRLHERRLASPSPHVPVLDVDLALDAGYGAQQSRGIAAGAALPVTISFRVLRASPSARLERDSRYTPRTALFVRPGIAATRLRLPDGSEHRGTVADLAVGASVLDFGLGFGFTGMVRRALVPGTGLQGAVAISWRAAPR